MKNYFNVLIWPIIFLIGQIFILVALSLILLLINPNIDIANYLNNNSYIVSIISLIIFLPLFIKQYSKYKDKYKGKLKDIPKIIIIGIILSLILNINIFKLNPNSNEPNFNIFYLINIVIIGPILEEYLFRGIVYNRLLEFNDETKSYIIAVVIFALFHTGGIFNVIYAFIMGLILNKLYIKQKTLKSSILFHIVINATASIIFPLLLSL